MVQSVNGPVYNHLIYSKPEQNNCLNKKAITYRYNVKKERKEWEKE